MPPSVTIGPYAIDDEGVSRLLDNGERESVRWADLVAVRILTTDQGPWMEDHFWVLVGTGGSGCVVAVVDEETFSRLVRQVPGFALELMRLMARRLRKDLAR